MHAYFLHNLFCVGLKIVQEINVNEGLQESEAYTDSEREYRLTNKTFDELGKLQYGVLFWVSLKLQHLCSLNHSCERHTREEARETLPFLFCRRINFVHQILRMLLTKLTGLLMLLFISNTRPLTRSLQKKKKSFVNIKITKCYRYNKNAIDCLISKSILNVLPKLKFNPNVYFHCIKRHKTFFPHSDSKSD